MEAQRGYMLARSPQSVERTIILLQVVLKVGAKKCNSFFIPPINAKMLEVSQLVSPRNHCVLVILFIACLCMLF